MTEIPSPGRPNDGMPGGGSSHFELWETAVNNPEAYLDVLRRKYDPRADNYPQILSGRGRGYITRCQWQPGDDSPWRAATAAMVAMYEPGQPSGPLPAAELALRETGPFLLETSFNCLHVLANASLRTALPIWETPEAIQRGVVGSMATDLARVLDLIREYEVFEGLRQPLPHIIMANAPPILGPEMAQQPDEARGVVMEYLGIPPTEAI